MTEPNAEPIRPEISDVLDFWFTEIETEKWFKRDEAFDETVRARFAGLYRRAAAGGCEDWRATGRGCLALIVVLDQFPRNMFRGDARSFTTDAAAHGVMRGALAQGFDAGLSPQEKQFLYMPLQHSENAADQMLSIELNEALGNEAVLNFARAHKRIIDRFGRFPHRNAVLGRESTPEEAVFLEEPDSSF